MNYNFNRKTTITIFNKTEKEYDPLFIASHLFEEEIDRINSLLHHH